MKRLLLLLAVCSLGCWAQAQQQLYAPMFNESVMSGKVGDTDVRLYLGPSPYISRGVVDFINSATRTLDICVYEMNLHQVVDAILEAHGRGVKVRVAVSPAATPHRNDPDLLDKFNTMKARNILRYTKNRSGLMHNKFMVADGRSVWTGSYNFTRNDTEMNDNNAVTFPNSLLAENYTAEFEEIWTGMHGKRNSTPTPHPVFRIGDVTVKNYFSPEDNVEAAIVDELMRATNSIYIMAFALTDRAMYSALTNQIAAGIKVFVLLDLTLSRQATSLNRPLREAGATVRISSNNGNMHHKVIVIDENVVITGSANFSASALNVNDENIIIFECPPLARAFMREFTRCWMAKPYIINKWTQPASR
ncbi:MAG TPA: phospholipase D-like domain-containing protein [Kiritimatiellia bacterium]|nr:phospholipase D-like domain-containing protein [Kiritimatiellia bacterium]